jgi:hypothetical protein
MKCNQHSVLPFQFASLSCQHLKCQVRSVLYENFQGLILFCSLRHRNCYHIVPFERFVVGFLVLCNFKGLIEIIKDQWMKKWATEKIFLFSLFCSVCCK